MKSNYFFFTLLLFALVLLLGFTSCTSSDNLMTGDISDSFETIKTMYGAEEVSNSAIKEHTVIPVSTTDMLAVLEILQQNSLHSKNCIVESGEGSPFKENGKEYIKKVIMSEQYTPITRSGNVLGDFILRVELNFNIDNDQIYYLGTDYLYNSELFEWRANGLSLFPSKNSNGYTYEFESESFLFFKLNDQGNITIKVPVAFKGKYDFQSEKGTYSFELQKHS